MRKNLSSVHKLVASHIQRDLDSLGISSRITSEKFYMGDIVTIYLEDASPCELEKIRKISKKYQFGTYYCDQDCYKMDNIIEGVPQVKYVHISNRPSAKTKLRISQILLSKNPKEIESMQWFDINEMIINCFGNAEFWKEHLAA